MSGLSRRSFVTGLAGASGGPLNILWLVGEDMGPQIGCYGYPQMRTPHLDKFASEGTRFANAFTTAPVCSPSRSAWNTGMYQTSIGAHHHRSHRKDGYRLPEGVKLISHRLRDAGYLTANVKDNLPGFPGMGKTDFNFQVDRPFETSDWSECLKKRPFFAQINFQETHKGPAFPAARRQSYLVDPKKIDLPPYYPDHPEIRDEFANYLDAMNLLDGKIGAVLKSLDDSGLSGNTAVFFFGDNGRCLVRGKQWLYDAGIHVPLLVRWPGGGKAGAVRTDLVSAIDIAATTLAAAGLAVPDGMQGRVMMGDKARPAREMIFAARDRCDETHDRIRCVRTKQFKLIRNFEAGRPYTQPNQYIESQYPTLGVMKRLHAEGKLKGSETLFMQPKKPEWELYDITKDPHEVNNLAGSKGHAKTRDRLAEQLGRWIEESKDQGREVETEEARRL